MSFNLDAGSRVTELFVTIDSYKDSYRGDSRQYLYHTSQIGYVGMKETVNGEVTFIRRLAEYRLYEEC